jgi:hypothetical protein
MATARRKSGALWRGKSWPLPDLGLANCCCGNRVRGTPDRCIPWEFMGVCDVQYWLRAESTSGGSGVRYIAGDGEQNAGFAVPPRVPAPAVRRPKLGLEWGDRRDFTVTCVTCIPPRSIRDGKLEQFNVDQVFARLQNGEFPQ